ncbi:MAG: cytochrome oxidase Cu insertion factor (SCO1/SenC/PrrC family) [Mariniblastus sp.]|jgi:cytochrome oxidase Cu insertion factor (SCO1/SenC/PrrC family)
MSKKVPVFLWSLVIMAAAAMIYWSNQQPAPPVMPGGSGSAEIGGAGSLTIDDKGRAFATVPWKHLPDVDRFKLIDQNGDKFDSADLTGQAYVVSFFFASCPTFCMDLNKTLERANASLKGTDIRFLTLTVQPEVDTPERLKTYAEGFGAQPERWAFLTGQKHQLVAVGEHTFNVPVDPDTHTDNILLVDKWGRYRDRFKWDQPYDMKRFIKVAKEVAAETEPPLDETIKTRNVMAGRKPANVNDVQWIKEFYLTERSGREFFSRELIGDVWIGNFFFSTCPGICPLQTKYLRDLQKRLGEKAPRVVSITTDSQTDTPEVLREYAEKFDADPEKWLFLTGDETYIERIGSEFFQASAAGGHHSSLLYVVDRWGDVRGKFDWEDPEEEIEMLKLVEALSAEDRPSRPVDVPRKQPQTTESDDE